MGFCTLFVDLFSLDLLVCWFAGCRLLDPYRPRGMVYGRCFSQV